MSGYEVTRVVPPEWLGPAYSIFGGVVRHARGTPGAGEIVGHLQFGTTEALEALGKPLQSLACATVAVSALNLAVTAAGFAYVCKRLNDIERQLSAISGKIDGLLEATDRLAWTQELERRAKWAAQVDNLLIALRTRDVGGASRAAAMLNESEKFYMALGDHLVSDSRRAYCETAVVQPVLQMATAAALARSRAFALLGHPEEAIRMGAALLEHASSFSQGTG